MQEQRGLNPQRTILQKTANQKHLHCLCHFDFHLLQLNYWYIHKRHLNLVE
uniref:NAC domain-containing protein 69 isoform X1 n=1 Tax=Rhizophora mucronata TaxID=61149 RepID=A0A2P2J902_RHIMU